jgi:hypothetical protein
MQRRTSLRWAVVLAGCGALTGAGAGDDKPAPLPPKVAKVWRDAGADPGWMLEVPPPEWGG